ncbi:hypothetical protein VB773_13435 [Haloarculaceae archaeon H-GB2-1]|nr:hypothetical protein [Haloarculaceae archaeon H-GB1-1]MEA5386968.1 hypothetical protein [Haloarculaceae archaeon H-GB11]MEA5408470.1 hypothetical protein [Haloarculaceae archaeon H-GB2-1]
MSQQLQQYPQGTQAQYQSGQQFGGQMGQQIGQRFDESVPNEVHQLVQQLDRLESVSAWAKSGACKQGMHQVASICEDIEDVAHLEKKLVLRQSPFARPIGESVKATIQSGVQTLQQAAGQPEVQDNIREAQQTLTIIDTALTQLQSMGQQTMGQQSMGQQAFGGSQQYTGQSGSQGVSGQRTGQGSQQLSPMTQ